MKTTAFPQLNLNTNFGIPEIRPEGFLNADLKFAYFSEHSTSIRHITTIDEENLFFLLILMKCIIPVHFLNAKQDF